MIKNNRVKLIDFGYALNEHKIAAKNIATGGIFEYIAPEKTKKSAFSYIDGNATYQSEIYQIGILLYRIIFEKLPFNCLTWSELRAEIISDKPISIAKKTVHGEFIGTSLIKIIEKCLRKNPKVRYKNAIELKNVFATIN